MTQLGTSARRFTLTAALFAMCAGVGLGCDGDETPMDAGTEMGADAGPYRLLADMCAPRCTADPAFPYVGPEEQRYICYDGCNWCTCTTEGPMSCTARACVGDAATDADGGT